MAKSEIIETARLRIESFGEVHLTQQYLDWMNDPEVVQFSEQRHRIHTMESSRLYWEGFRGSPHFFWAIIAKEEHPGHIGNLNAYLDVPNGVADLGILIGAKATWGRGLGSEAWRAVCGYLFEKCGIRKVTAGTLATNRGMLGIMEKAGMLEDGTRARHCLVGGVEVDMVHASLFREDWR